MKHYLQPCVLGAPPPLDLTEAQYRELENASKILNAAFALEENFDILLGNYVELESTALAIAASAFVRQELEYGDFFRTRAKVNRRAVNLLSTARLYIDQLPRNAGKVGLDPAQVRQWLAEQYDANFEYRFMEALRNHAQHSGSAVHSAAVHRTWLPPDGRTHLQHYTAVRTLRRHLEGNEKFKKATLKECPEEIDFLVTTRPYIEALWRVHARIRERSGAAVSAARKLFDDTIRQYADYSNSSTLGLTAFACQDADVVGRVSVFLEWDNVRVKLEKRNSNLQSLSKYVATSESLGQAKSRHLNRP